MVAKQPKMFRKRRARNPLKKRKLVPSKALVKAVKAIQFKAQETKKVQTTILSNMAVLGNGLNYNFANDTWDGGGGKANVLASAANIACGTSEHNRVGNEISTMSMNLKGFIKCLPYASDTNPNRTPFDLYMVIYKRKNEPDGTVDKLIDYTNGTKGVITGSIITTVLSPFNRDNYIIKKLIKFPMKAQPNIGLNTVTATQGATIENPETGRGTRSYFRTFNVRVPIKKVLKFNTNNQSAPVNEWFGVGFYYINGDATATSAIPASEIRAQVTMESILKFKDA